MRLLFVETPMFAATAKGLLTDAEMRSLGDTLLRDPFAGEVEDGTGGCRKVRVRLPGRGKSGGARVMYMYVPAKARVYYLIAYGKNVQSSLTAEQKRRIRKLAAQLREER